jgi:hypothetical protein
MRKPIAIKAIDIEEGDVIVMNKDRMYVHCVHSCSHDETRVRYTYDPDPTAYPSATSWYDNADTLWVERVKP